MLIALACLMVAPAGAATAPATGATPPPPSVPTLAQTRGLSCTGDDRSVREIVIDFTAGRWREGGSGWTKIAAQDDSTITLVKQGGGFIDGILSDTRRLEQLDRATLVLSTQLRAGLIDEARSYHCKIVEPFDAKRQI